MSAYLSRTPSSTGNRSTFTLSVWCKKMSSSTQDLLGAGASNAQNHIQFENDRFQIRYFNTSNATIVNTDALLRDQSAWYHLVMAVDTTQSTASNRVKIYINGELQSLNDTTYPGQNFDWGYNVSGETMYIGRRGHSNAYLYDGIMAHYHWIDGTQYAASDFGETDSTTGIWKPILTPSVTYGTNGFFLKFDNTSNFGEDSSGNNNDFSMTNTITQTIDTPSNVFATMNSLDNYWQGSTFSDGNLTVTTTNASQAYSTSSIMVSSGKWYVECKPVSGGSEPEIGIFSKLTGANAGNNSQLSYNANGYAYRASNPGSVWYNGSAVSTGFSQYANGDIIGIALDLDNNKLYFSKNGTFGNSGDPTSGATGTGAISIVDPASTTLGAYGFAMNETFNDQNKVFSWNFGNGYFGTTAVSSAGTNAGVGTFEYDVPSGYKALCTKNINAEEYS